jgi:hypothetical protein
VLDCNVCSTVGNLGPGNAKVLSKVVISLRVQCHVMARIKPSGKYL